MQDFPSTIQKRKKKAIPLEVREETKKLKWTWLFAYIHTHLAASSL